MAAANESQGLKIAVAAFITLTVILMVSSYFLYSNGAAETARNDAAQESLRKAKAAQDLAVTQYETLRNRIGAKVSEIDAVNEEMAGHMKKMGERLGATLEPANAAVSKAQQSGAQGPELDEARQNVQKAIASFQSEPNKTYMSAMDRMAEIFESYSMLTTEMALNYLNLRRSLEVGHRASPRRKWTCRPVRQARPIPRQLKRRRGTKRSGARS